MKKIILVLALCFCSISYSQVDSKKACVYTTVSYFMGASGGCNDIWVGVFCTSDSQTLLISSGTAHVGPGCSKLANNDNSSLCEDEIYKGDLIENSKYKEFKYCLTDLLKDDDIYSKYESDKNKILSKRK